MSLNERHSFMYVCMYRANMRGLTNPLSIIVLGLGFHV